MTVEIVQLGLFACECPVCFTSIKYEWADLEQPRIPDEMVTDRVKCPTCQTWITHNKKNKTWRNRE